MRREERQGEGKCKASTYKVGGCGLYIPPFRPAHATVFVAILSMPSTDARPRAMRLSSLIRSSTAADVRADVAYLEEYDRRWKNHLQMLETVAQSNIDPETAALATSDSRVLSRKTRGQVVTSHATHNRPARTGPNLTIQA